MMKSWILRILQIVCLLAILCALYFQSDLLLIAAAVITAVSIGISFSSMKGNK